MSARKCFRPQLGPDDQRVQQPTDMPVSPSSLHARRDQSIINRITTLVASTGLAAGLVAGCSSTEPSNATCPIEHQNLSSQVAASLETVAAPEWYTTGEAAVRIPAYPLALAVNWVTLHPECFNELAQVMIRAAGDVAANLNTPMTGVIVLESDWIGMITALRQR